MITHQFGRVPRRGERMRIGNLVFEVLRADGRQVHMLLLRRVEPSPAVQPE